MPDKSIFKLIIVFVLLVSTHLNAALNISLSSNSISEGSPSIGIIVSQDNPSEPVANFCIIASGGTAVSADLVTTIDGDAFAGLPLGCSPTTYGVPAAQTSSGTFVFISAVDDGLEEGSETVTFSLYNVTNSTIGVGSVTLTINDPVQPAKLHSQKYTQ